MVGRTFVTCSVLWLLSSLHESEDIHMRVQNSVVSPEKGPSLFLFFLLFLHHPCVALSIREALCFLLWLATKKREPGVSRFVDTMSFFVRSESEGRELHVFVCCCISLVSALISQLNSFQSTGGRCMQRERHVYVHRDDLSISALVYTDVYVEIVWSLAVEPMQR